MKTFNKIICCTLVSIILFSNHMFSFANAENSNSKNIIIEENENTTLIEELIEKLYIQYPDAWKIKPILNENNIFYFRIFPKRGSTDYFIVKYNNNTENNLPKTKELIWIWSKKYDVDIRDIRFKNINIKEHTADAKVYLRNNKIINEKIVFIDTTYNGDKYLHFIEK